MERLTTGCTSLDELLRGGFPIHQLSFIYGEASTGKTILASQCALEAATRSFKVFYVDTDQSFYPQRFDSFILNPEAGQRIVIFHPEDFQEQVKIIETLENLMTKNPAVLVIDSMTGLYRAGLARPKDVFAYNRELNRQLAYLDDLSRRYQLGIILTGEVHSQPARIEWSIEPVATRAMRHWSRLILRLRPTPRKDLRECILEKIDGINLSGPKVLFRITESGIQDA